MDPKGYERLSAQDASFLVFETPETPMNVGGASIFGGGPRLGRGGGLDIERIKRHIASRLHRVPRYRQRLAYVPLANEPVWIDDDRFDIDYHVHHIALPRRDGDRALKRLTADILAQPLDRRRPLWEFWVVEGLDRGRFATVTKAHHCMVDGVSGLDLAVVAMRVKPDTRIERAPAWQPLPAPPGIELLRDDVLRRARLPFAQAPRGRGGDALRSDLGQRLTAVWNTVSSGLQGAADTPLNRPIGPHRRVDWLQVDLAEVKRVKNHFAVTVNDVVLATVAGAVRRFFKRRGAKTRGADFRVAIPVNVRAPGDRSLGNRVSVWLMAIPIDESDPVRRLKKVNRTTTALKEKREALGADSVMRILEWTGTAILSLGVRFANRMSPYNLIVTNVPGPPFPLYFLGAKLLEAYAQVPLFTNQGLGVALFSYEDKLFWGFNGDWDLMPDLADFAADVDLSFRELSRAAGSKRARR